MSNDGATEIAVHGDVRSDFAAVRSAFADVLQADRAGGALCVVHRGETVVDLWGGVDPLSGTAWERDSTTLAFSAAKGIVAMLVAQQIQRGTIDPLAPVAAYWPEFAVAGKASITVADVLTHTAGMPTLPLDDARDLLDPVRLAARAAQRSPDYPPGSARVYHVLSYGLLAGEILRRVTGLDAGALLQQEIAAPLGADLWLGTPPEADGRFRPVLMDPIVPPPEPGGTDSASGAACRSAYTSTLQIVPLFEREDGVQGTELVNGSDFRRALVPGGGLVATARGIARAYGACVAPVDGVRLLDDDTVAKVSADWLDGVAEPACNPAAALTTRWGLGFEIAHELCPMLGPGSFGHAGMGGRLAFAHPGSRTGFAFIGQRMLFPEPGRDPRWRRLLDALAPALG
ncbi:serine hydrolase domain-containing protein [Microbacterium laevaniformans]|uniref:serine hydrolase domain-containing protein n=1 Tax=Microbacterium laevaniformans TaxID=36807 RepID=UPI003D98F88C